MAPPVIKQAIGIPNPLWMQGQPGLWQSPITQSGVVLSRDSRPLVPIVLRFEVVSTAPIQFAGNPPADFIESVIAAPHGGRPAGSTIQQPWQAVSAVLPAAITAFLALVISVRYAPDPAWYLYPYQRQLIVRTP